MSCAFRVNILISHVNFDKMTSNSFDPNQSKIGRDQIWDSAAQGYRIWWPHIEKAAQSLSNRLVELAEIKPGQQILDIATGHWRASFNSGKNCWIYWSYLGY